MREARCLQSNNTREARSITYSTSSSSTHENSTHTDTTEATPLGRLRSPWIPPFDPPGFPPPPLLRTPPPIFPSESPTPTLRHFWFFRAYRERFAYAPVYVELNERQSNSKETSMDTKTRMLLMICIHTIKKPT